MAVLPGIIEMILGLQEQHRIKEDAANYQNYLAQAQHYRSSMPLGQILGQSDPNDPASISRMMAEWQMHNPPPQPPQFKSSRGAQFAEQAYGQIPDITGEYIKEAQRKAELEFTGGTAAYKTAREERGYGEQEKLQAQQERYGEEQQARAQQFQAGQANIERQFRLRELGIQNSRQELAFKREMLGKFEGVTSPEDMQALSKMSVDELLTDPKAVGIVNRAYREELNMKHFGQYGKEMNTLENEADKIIDQNKKRLSNLGVSYDDAPGTSPISSGPFSIAPLNTRNGMEMWFTAVKNKAHEAGRMAFQQTGNPTAAKDAMFQTYNTFLHAADTNHVLDTLEPLGLIQPQGPAQRPGTVVGEKDPTLSMIQKDTAAKIRELTGIKKPQPTPWEKYQRKGAEYSIFGKPGTNVEQARPQPKTPWYQPQEGE